MYKDLGVGQNLMSCSFLFLKINNSEALVPIIM